MYYAMVGVISIVIHLIVNHRYFINTKKLDKVNLAFKRYTVAALLYYISDVLWGLIYELKIPTLLYVDTLVYYVAMALTVVLLFRYVTCYLRMESGLGKVIRYLGDAFGAFEMALLVINHFNHIFFWINPDGSYQAYTMRYVALYMQVLLCVVLAVLTGSVTRKAKVEDKKRYITIFVFCVVMTVGILAQILYPLLPIYSVGLVIGISIIHIFVEEGEKEEQYKVLQSMADIYYSMHVIDLEHDTVQDVNAKNQVKEVVNQVEGAREMMKKIINLVVVEEDLDRMLSFTDLTTIEERMLGKKVISTQFLGKNFGWTNAVFISIDLDNDGKPNKVIFTTRVIDDEKKREQQLIANAQIDELTGLFNRREYEDDVAKYAESPVDPNFVFAAIDINGLKVVNDEIGHAAGDELIKGAAECMKNTLGVYGKVYRTGGDEFVAIFQADEDHLKIIENDLEEAQLTWSGKLVDSLSLSVGYVTRREFESEPIEKIAEIADERMYKAKTEYYSRKGVDRKGQAAAHTALCKLYTKILKINITTDTYAIVNMDLAEQTPEKGFADSISGWLRGFGKSGQVHSDDLDEYLRKTDIEYLRKYFSSGKTSISIFYRRKYSDGFKQVAMDIIMADDYSDSNQTLFLYVKNIDM